MDDEQYWTDGDLSFKDIGAMVKNIRREHLNLTHEQMAKDLKMKVSTLKNYEKGKMKPAFKLINDVCERYGLEATLRISTKSQES